MWHVIDEFVVEIADVEKTFRLVAGGLLFLKIKIQYLCAVRIINTFLP